MIGISKLYCGTVEDGRVRFRGFPEGEPRGPDDYWLLIYECGADGQGPVLVGKQRYIRFISMSLFGFA